MSFSGKKYRRTGGSNLDDFFKSSNIPDQVKKLMSSNAPIWCFRLMDEDMICLEVQMESFKLCHSFKLGEEKELIRRDGSKVKMTVTMEGDNVLKQRIRKPDGSTAYFKREFHERTATMTITMEGADSRKAHVFYEVVD